MQRPAEGSEGAGRDVGGAGGHGGQPGQEPGAGPVELQGIPVLEAAGLVSVICNSTELLKVDKTPTYTYTYVKQIVLI